MKSRTSPKHLSGMSDNAVATMDQMSQDNDEDDEEMEAADETPDEGRQPHVNRSQSEVSDHGHLEWDQRERMVSFSRANQI